MKNLKLIYAVLLSLAALAMVSCQNDLDSAIHEAIQDKVVTEEEWDDIVIDAQSDKRFDKNFADEDGNLDQARLLKYIQGKYKRAKIEWPQIGKKSNLPTKVNVYIENSASMDGYVNGGTEFVDAIGQLLIDLWDKYNSTIESENVNLYFINENARKVEGATKAAITADESIVNYWVDAKKDKRGNSKLENIFKQVLEATDQNTITILVSDCIYSVNGKDSKAGLIKAKQGTESSFLSAYKKNKINLATTIVKMSSLFSGTYYTKNNEKIQLNNTLRPYYIVITGSESAMKDFKQNIKFNSNTYKGYENKYELTPGGKNRVYYSVLKKYGIPKKITKGRFTDDKNYSGKDYIHGISNLKKERNAFSFAVAVNLDDCGAEPEYYDNIKNYQLTPNNYYTIKEIIPIRQQDMTPRDWKKIEKNNPNRIIIIEAIDRDTPSVTVSLKEQIPGWVAKTNEMDDSNPYPKKDKKGNQILKTFGIQYLIEGISGAYNKMYNNENIFDLEINVR